MIKLVTFSYKAETVEISGYVIDCRTLRNPWYNTELRSLLGQNESVQAYVRDTPGFEYWFNDVLYIARCRGELWLGCHGGMHRSVAVAEMLRRRLEEEGHEVEVQHRALESR